MSQKIRKQIYLDASQDARLKELSAASGESEASIIRRAIDRIADQLQDAPMYDLLDQPEAWDRAMNRMRRSMLVPRPGVRIVDREFIYER